MTLNHDLQHTAARVLTRLLDTPAMPQVTWYLYDPSRAPQLYTDPTEGFHLLEGQAHSHQAVRDWAAHLGTQVKLRRGTTPDAHAIIDGIVVRVWCAPMYRDDIPTDQETVAAGRP